MLTDEQKAQLFNVLMQASVGERADIIKQAQEAHEKELLKQEMEAQADLLKTILKAYQNFVKAVNGFKVVNYATVLVDLGGGDVKPSIHLGKKTRVITAERMKVKTKDGKTVAGSKFLEQCGVVEYGKSAITYLKDNGGGNNLLEKHGAKLVKV